MKRKAAAIILASNLQNVFICKIAAQQSSCGPWFEGLHPKSVLFRIIVKFDSILVTALRKERKCTKEAGFGPYYAKKTIRERNTEVSEMRNTLLHVKNIHS